MGSPQAFAIRRSSLKRLPKDSLLKEEKLTQRDGTGCEDRQKAPNRGKSTGRLNIDYKPGPEII
jgi:hypothetical protein